MASLVTLNAANVRALSGFKAIHPIGNYCPLYELARPKRALLNAANRIQGERHANSAAQMS
jgi:hypothetical protein